MSLAANLQLALPLRSPPLQPAADFLACGSNSAALQWLATSAAWPGHRLVLWGPAGCGKTHLARSWAHQASALWFDRTPPEHLIDLAPSTRIVVDGADQCRSDAALLHWLNAGAEAACLLLLTAHAPPSRWPTGLPDLQSRLRATTVVGIDPPEDELLRALLARLLAERQLSVALPLQQWLVLMLPRTAAALQEAVARLDRASLAERQPVTRGLARACLSDMLADASGD